MPRRLCAAALVAFTLAAAACGGGIFATQYEYEEDLTLNLDGSGALVVNASLASLSALRGLPVPTDNSRFERAQVRALFTSPVTEVTRVSREWRRNGRRFVQVRVKFSDIRRLHGAPPFSWSRYSLTQKDGEHIYTQTVGASAMKPGSLQNYGWDGSEIVAFRLHLPSKITWHNARDLESNDTRQPDRGNILAWEQHLADRLDGRPVEVMVKMESRSILHRTLWLFAGAFTAAVLVIVLLVWWTFRKGRVDNSKLQTPNSKGAQG